MRFNPPPEVVTWAAVGLINGILIFHSPLFALMNGLSVVLVVALKELEKTKEQLNMIEESLNDPPADAIGFVVESPDEDDEESRTK